MQIVKPTHYARTQAARFLSLGLLGILAAAPLSNAADGLLDAELLRRQTVMQEAHELLIKGDESMAAKKYDQAVEAYSGACDMIPVAPVLKELRDTAIERYAVAAMAQAKVLVAAGDVAAGRSLLDRVLVDGIAPNHAGTLALRASLDDTIRTNPALTAKHTQDVDNVEQAFRYAESALDLGRFDDAEKSYHRILEIDPTNAAARRGLESITNQKSKYFRTAYDQTRSEMLGAVDAEWESIVPSENAVLVPKPVDSSTLSTISLEAKLKSIILPRVSLEQVTLSEAVEYLRAMSSREDKMTLNPAERGLNFNINFGDPNSTEAKQLQSIRFDLNLTQVPISQVLKYITEYTKTSYSVDDYAVIITPRSLASEELITRDYKVPPTFLSSLSAGAGAEGTNQDPFTQQPKSLGQGALLTRRLSAQEVLVKQGVTFPEGAMASYRPNANLLRVINTPRNHDIIEQIVDGLTQIEPVTVSVKVTIIRTQQTNLKELGFDWLLTPVGMGDTVLGGGTIGSALGRTAGDFSPGVLPPGDPSASVSQGVLTNGLRSGDQANTKDSLDRLIANPNRDTQRTVVAPGILSLSGIFNSSQAQLIMRGLDQKKGVDLMSQPSVITRSGQSSVVDIAREFIYPTEYDPPELQQGNGNNGGGGNNGAIPASPSAYEMREVGVHLEVLPVADADKNIIDLTLNPSIVDFDGFVNFGSPVSTIVNGLLGPQRVNITGNQILMPIFSTQRVTTHLSIADGATIAFGGLMSSKIQRVDDKVPLLGDVPLLGRWFRSTSHQPITTAVVFLVHVQLMDPTGRPYHE